MERKTNVTMFGLDIISTGIALIESNLLVNYYNPSLETSFMRSFQSSLAKDKFLFA